MTLLLEDRREGLEPIGSSTIERLIWSLMIVATIIVGFLIADQAEGQEVLHIENALA